MKSGDGASRIQEIVNELREAITRMSAELPPDVEPAILFSLEPNEATTAALMQADHDRP